MYIVITYKLCTYMDLPWNPLPFVFMAWLRARSYALRLQLGNDACVSVMHNHVM